uniref:Uncharacterized protein n=1 Tax=Podoviridae sp. ctxqo3 TaxID=2827755 RepID=A0A8S5T0D5_9CAUD|nr:MAG TPA: hypothetical protein [Podoviridae sp. ctxqo3]
MTSKSNIYCWANKMVRRLSHTRTVMFCFI